MKYITQKHLTVFLTFIAFGIAGFTVWSSAQSKNIERVIVENKTSSLAIESINELNKSNELSVFEVSVKNNYEKSISIFRFRTVDDLTKNGDINGVERGGLTDGWMLRPNETTTIRFSAAKTGNINLIVAAVLFEDGTGDGVKSDVTLLQNVREGVLLGFQKIIPILKEETKTSGFLSSDAAIDELKKKIEQIDDSQIPDVSKRGFATAKGFVKFEIEDLKERNNSTNFDVNAEFLIKLDNIESTVLTLSAKPASNNNKKKGGKNEN